MPIEQYNNSSYTIDWGDGTVNTNTNTHTYSDKTKTYKIKITGEAKWLYPAGGAPNDDYQRSLMSISSSGKCPIRLYHPSAFAMCDSNLTTVSGDLFNNIDTSAENCWDLSQFFLDDTYLNSIPDDIFKSVPNEYTTNILWTFYDTRLTKLPPLWNTHNLTKHQNCFGSCSNASNYPEAVKKGWAGYLELRNCALEQSSEAHVSLPLKQYNESEYIIDWGDGTVTTNTNEHTYSSASSKISIIISGEAIWEGHEIIGIDEFELSVTGMCPIKAWTHVENDTTGFAGSNITTAFYAMLFNNIDTSYECDYHSFFENCTKLREVNSSLFKPTKLAAIPNDSTTNVNSMFRGCTSLNQIPQIWKTHDAITHDQFTFDYCEKAIYYTQAVEAKWAKAIGTMELNLEVPSGSVTMNLGIWLGQYSGVPNITCDGRSRGTIDWGDGNEQVAFVDTDSSEDPKFVHTYSTGIHKITLRGKIMHTGIFNTRSTSDYSLDKFVKSITIPDGEKSPLVGDYGNKLGVFAYATALESVPENIFEQCYDCINIGDDTFLDCKQLKEIPEGIFKECKAAKRFVQTFRYCKSLKAIPLHLFDNQTDVTTFAYCFCNTDNIEGEVPDLWNQFPNAYGHDCFYSCTKASNYSQIPDSWIN